MPFDHVLIARGSKSHPWRHRPPHSGMKTVTDLKGKKLLCFATTPWAPFIDNFLAKGGLDRNNVEISMVPPATMAAVYMSNGADGIMTVEPFGLPIAEKTFTKGKPIGKASLFGGSELALRDIKASGAISKFTKPQDYFTDDRRKHSPTSSDMPSAG
jgi:hypothetical protein